MEKPIQRDMMGVMNIMVLVVLAVWSFTSPFMLLVFMEIREKKMLVTPEITGIRNRPRPARPFFQNMSSGLAARFTPRKEKSMEKMASAREATAAFTASRFSGVMRDVR